MHDDDDAPYVEPFMLQTTPFELAANDTAALTPLGVPSKLQIEQAAAVSQQSQNSDAAAVAAPSLPITLNHIDNSPDVRVPYAHSAQVPVATREVQGLRAQVNNLRQVFLAMHSNQPPPQYDSANR